METRTGEITFFDIPNAEGKPWSPNTFKTRAALNYKNVPYKTEWTEYPDIAPRLKSLGLGPNDEEIKGARWTGFEYSCPAVQDSIANLSSPVVIMESLSIAEHLDKTYPTKPKLFRGSEEQIKAQYAALDKLAGPVLAGAIFPLVIHSSCSQLSPASQAYFIETRRPRFGELDQLTPPGSDKEAEAKAKAKASWTSVARDVLGPLDAEDGLLHAEDEDNGKSIGKKPTYVLLCVGATLEWIRIVGRPGLWEEICTWDDGYWKKVHEETEEYMV